MTVESQHDIEALKEIGRIVALTIQEMKTPSAGRNDAVSAPKAV